MGAMVYVDETQEQGTGPYSQETWGVIRAYSSSTLLCTFYVRILVKPGDVAKCPLLLRQNSLISARQVCDWDMRIGPRFLVLGLLTSPQSYRIPKPTPTMEGRACSATTLAVWRCGMHFEQGGERVAGAGRRPYRHRYYRDPCRRRRFCKELAEVFPLPQKSHATAALVLVLVLPLLLLPLLLRPRIEVRG